MLQIYISIYINIDAAAKEKWILYTYVHLQQTRALQSELPFRF